jgi:serine/threonine-protein kinase
MARELVTSPDSRKRFLREARLAANLHHPNIITIYDFGEEDGILFIAMELLDGADLKSTVDGRDVALDQKLDWMLQLCRAFSYAHRHGIVHRDIKPCNIHIRSNKQLVVTDFGIARVANSDITRKGVILGTPDYIAPEQILDIHVDQRADIFALGLLFFELLTGQHPFRTSNIATTAHRLLNENAVPPHQIDPAIPEALSGVVLRALEKNVNHRYQNCEKMLQELVAVIQEQVQK